MSVTVIALVSINEDQPYALAKYLEHTEPLLEWVGTKIISRYSLERELVGELKAKTVIIVEYPGQSAVEEVFKSDEYARAIPDRDGAFSEYSIHIAE